MGSTTYKRQPVSRVGSSYQGDLVRTILREMDEELLRLASQVALTTEPDPNDELELSNYFFLPGRTGNQVAHGGVGSAGYLQLWSASLTGASDAGFLQLLTDATTTNDIVRIGRGGGGAITSSYFRMTRDGQMFMSTATTGGVLNIAWNAGGTVLRLGTAGSSPVMTFQPTSSSFDIAFAGLGASGVSWTATLTDMNGRLLVDGAADAVQLTVEANATQTANLQNWVSNAAGAVLASVTSAGHLQTSLVSLKGVTSGNYASLAAADTTATYTLKLPQTIAGATFGQLLVYDGSGGLTFASLDADLAALAGITRDRGDLIVGGASAWVDLPIGPDGYAFHTDGVDPSWVLNPGWLGDHTWIDCRPVIKGVAAGPLPIQWWNTASGANLSLYIGPSYVISTTNFSANIEVPNIPGQPPITGSGSNPPTATQVLGKVNLTGRTADIASTNLTSGAPAGMYQVQAYLVCEVAQAGASVLTLNFAWNDGAARTDTLTRGMGATGISSISKVIYLASGNISYSITGYIDPGGAPVTAYGLRIRVTFVGT